eukprot:CAMPEP_0185792588 /NCGR_PEP_ID=MMETSP1174-20130828/159017_1 /TAXON_ID=35687 /ORGANISM="Dictyocha speculum, Strain CCMP1381" /LENGTH=42 /DNA_ID= /DNA_START= /DNA_END= /DNA_ORIENTATION=
MSEAGDPFRCPSAVIGGRPTYRGNIFDVQALGLDLGEKLFIQ